ncbi:Zn-dependent exopeptidase, partial [Violaceomyces palustris]
DLLAQRLSQAVQIDTSVGDSWPSPTEDPERWSKFEAFHQHLVQTYPLTHQSLDLEKVNTHGLLYTWKGSESDLKPILLMSHQDVVPVNPETVEDWEHPPFSGFIDREKRVVWGRGSTDAKAWLVSILSSVEDLLAKGFQPNRTVLLSFGFDEEANGIHGASHLASRMEEIYGRDGLAMIVDEGNPVLSAEDPLGPGVAVALPGVEEKGSLDVEISIQSPGGHSSDPPQHTSIGLLAKVISQLEDSKDTLRPENLAEGGAQLRFLQCIREAPRFPPRLRSALKDLEWASRSSYGSNLLERLSERNREKRIRRAKERVIQSMPQRFKTQFLTTIAVDIVSGGIKINALPESAKAMINHRISTSSDIRWLEEKYVKDLSSLCQSLGLEFWAFGKRIVGEEEGEEGKVWVGKLIVEKVKQGFQPAPSTPLQGSEAKAWRLFSSVIRSTWPDKVGGKGNILVAPAIMQGNSDVR